MKRRLSIILIIGFILPIPFSCSRNTALEKTRNSNLEQLEKKIFVLVPEKELPKDNLPSERIKLELNDRTLYATWVSADEKAPAFFLLHGNGENISEWRPLQAYLLKKGYSSFVFDYTGFGSSTGQPSFSKLNADAMEAYKKFVSLTSKASERIAFAHSLGCSILLDIANKLKPLPTKVVVHGAFTSVRDILVLKGRINDSTRTTYPDVWNGLKNVQKIKTPLFILHSINDKVIPIYMGEELARSAGNKAKFLKLETSGHNAIYEIPTDSTWNPIFDFIK